MSFRMLSSVAPFLVLISISFVCVEGNFCSLVPRVTEMLGYLRLQVPVLCQRPVGSRAVLVVSGQWAGASA